MSNDRDTIYKLQRQLSELTERVERLEQTTEGFEEAKRRIDDSIRRAKHG